MRFNQLIYTAKELIKDPGFGFSVCCTLLFAATSPVGLAGCLTASALVVGMKTAQVVNPSFMQKDNLLTRIIKDSRTPLRILGLALLTVMGATLSQNMADLLMTTSSLPEFMAKGWLSTILPAVASTVFAIGNFKYAAVISESMKTQKEGASAAPSPASKANLWQLVIHRPETYNAIGMVSVGLLSGGASLLSLPLVLSAFTLSMRNIMQNRPGHEGHPNMHFAGSMAVLSAVGFVAAQPVLGIAYLLDGFYLGRIEVLTTPGGFKQVMQDMKEGAGALLRKVSGKKVDLSLKEDMSLQPVSSAASSVLPAANTLKQGFEVSRDRKGPAASAPRPVPPVPSEGLDI